MHVSQVTVNAIHVASCMAANFPFIVGKFVASSANTKVYGDGHGWPFPSFFSFFFVMPCYEFTVTGPATNALKGKLAGGFIVAGGVTT